MAEYELNDQDRADLVKNFFSRYGYFILILLIIIAVAVGIHAYMRNHAQKQSEAASIAYEALMTSIHNGASANEIKAAATQIIKDYPNTAYSSMAELNLASLSVVQNDFATAETVLQQVLAQNKNNTLTPIITMRLARVLLAENKAQAALLLLQKPPEGFSAPYELLEGDAYVMLNNAKAAQAAYQSALKTAQDNPLITQLLNERLNNLSSAS